MAGLLTDSGAAPPLGTVVGPARPAPRPQSHQIYFTLAELTLCAITMSTMLTQQAMPASLKVMRDSIRLESSRLAGVLSTVKVPDDAAAKASLRQEVKSHTGATKRENGLKHDTAANTGEKCAHAQNPTRAQRFG